jgi:hypothetical protein
LRESGILDIMAGVTGRPRPIRPPYPEVSTLKQLNSVLKRSYSRRDFLKGGTLGLAVVMAIGAVSGRLLRGHRPPVVPEDSIFTPAKDRYRGI